MGFAAEQTSTPAAVRLTVADEIDIENAPQFRRALEAAVDAAESAGLGRVVVDLGAVTYLDSSGLSALVASRAHADRAGVVLALAAVPRRIQKVLAITGLDTVFPVDSGPA